MPTARDEELDWMSPTPSAGSGDADKPIADWMAARADTEPGFAKGPMNKRSIDGDHHGATIDVHFDGSVWCVEDQSLDKPLEFDHLADAELRAQELSKDTGHSVCVHGQDGSLLAAYGETSK